VIALRRRSPRRLAWSIGDALSTRSAYFVAQYPLSGENGKAQGVDEAFPIPYLRDVAEIRRGPFRRSDYEVTLLYGRGYERYECIGVAVHAVSRTAPGNHLVPITASEFRSLRIGELINEHRPRDFVSVQTPGEMPVIASVNRGRGGRPPLYKPEHWSAVADIYRAAFADGRLTPTRAVAREFRVPQSTAAKWVARCRDLGLLPLTTRGKARSAAPPKKKRKGRAR